MIQILMMNMNLNANRKIYTITICIVLNFFFESTAWCTCWHWPGWLEHFRVKVLKIAISSKYIYIYLLSNHLSLIAYIVLFNAIFYWNNNCILNWLKPCTIFTYRIIEFIVWASLSVISLFSIFFCYFAISLFTYVSSFTSFMTIFLNKFYI